LLISIILIVLLYITYHILIKTARLVKLVPEFLFLSQEWQPAPLKQPGFKGILPVSADYLNLVSELQYRFLGYYL